MRTRERILVTGAVGFVGSTFVRKALKSSRNFVVSLDSLKSGRNLDLVERNLSHPRHHLIRGGTEDSDLIQRILREFSITKVVHCAAETGVDRSIGDPLLFVRNNVVGTARLLDGVAQYWDRLHPRERQSFRFVQISTMEVYGSSPDESHLSETAPLAPGSPYAASKAAADTMIHTYHRTYGLPTVVARFAAPYGPLQRAEKLVPNTIIKGLTHCPIQIYGDGLHQHDWIHADDQCRAILCLLAKGAPGRTYNFGDETAKSSLEVVTTICRILDNMRPGSLPRESLIEFVNDRPGHDRCRVADSTRAHRELGWTTEIPFSSGLQSVVQEVVRRYEETESQNVRTLRFSGDRVATEFSI